MQANSARLLGGTAFVVLAFFAGCHFGLPPVQGSGVSKTETRAITDFDQVEVSHAVNLELRVGPAASLEVTADDNILPLLKTELKGKTLQIFVDRSVTTKTAIKVRATTPALTSLEGSGATSSTVTGVETTKFGLDLSGASTCNLSCKGEELDVSLSGASQCTITGEAQKLKIHGSGASRLNATDFTASSVSADLSGASTAVVRATDEVNASASGASTLHYIGEPEKVTRSVSGAATVGPKSK